MEVFTHAGATSVPRCYLILDHVVAKFNRAALWRRPLSEVFAQLPDRRDPRGMRHSVTTAVLIAQGVGPRRRAGSADTVGIDPKIWLPSGSTIRRTLAALDTDDLDARPGGVDVYPGRAPGRAAVIAVDENSLRGATGPTAKMRHLLAALHHDTGVVAGQLAVATKSNEIPALPVLLDR